MTAFPHKGPDFLVQMELHNALFLIVPGMGLHASAGQLDLAAYGNSVNKNNKGRILADGEEVLSREHELKGVVLPHYNIVPPLPPNLLVPLLISSSSTKLQFAVGSVKGADGPIAASPIPLVGLPMACADPFATPAVALTSGTVQMGFTFGDFITGITLFATDMMLDYTVGKFMDSKFASNVGKKMFPGLRRSMMNKWVKLVVGKEGPKALSQVHGRSAFLNLFKKTGGNFLGTQSDDFIERVTKDLIRGQVGGIVRDFVGNPIGDVERKYADYMDARAEKL